MIVTIDGPAGVGKSSVAQKLAEQLGFRFLDTGAMYRAVTLAALERQLDLKDEVVIGQLPCQLTLQLVDGRTLLDGVDVSQAIRDEAITSQTRYVANNSTAREHLVHLQRRMAEGHDLVTEGRDQGTVAFPRAECKFFLTASEEERARRRWEQLKARGVQADLGDILAKQRVRDQEDAARPVGRLVPATDAMIVSTDGLTEMEVVNRLVDHVRRKMKELGDA